MSFDDLGLGPDILRAIDDAGYKEPTPIQQQAIPYVLMGRDVLGSAQTGTGKTASFTLPMIEILSAGRARARMPRSLILTPTRELATQIAENFEIYGKHHKLDMALLIGGVSMDEQVKKLDRGVAVLIATPGRLLDHFERGRILMSDIKVLVIDEADRMLDMGFIPDVERIVASLPKIRQTLFFSATIPPVIRKLADKFLMNPKEITVAPPSKPAAESVTQGMAIVSEMDKREALRQLIRTEEVNNALIFCNRKKDVDILFRSLKKHGFSVAALHGDMTQSSRTETLEAFKNDEMKLLVASDVAARGLDIDDLSHVINFDVPMHAEDYIHRIGRTGRAGRSGRAFTLATPDDSKFVGAITQLLSKEIPRIEIDGVKQLELGDRDPGGRRGRRGTGHRNANGADRKAKPAQSDHGERKERPERKAKPERDERTERRPASKDAKSGDKQRGRRGGRKTEANDNRSDEPIVGMGPNTPAFMLRPGRTSGSGGT